MNKKGVNPAAEALNKPNPFVDGTYDGTTKIKEGAGYDPSNPNADKIQIIDDEAFEVPKNTKIEVPNPEDPNEIIEVDNTSRGIVGFVSNPDKIAELKAQGIPVNDNKPLSPSVEELQKRFDDSKQNKANKKRIQDERAKKMRCKMQKAKYNPPEDLKNVPGLEPYDPNQDDVQKVKPQADQGLGEVILEDNEGRQPDTPGTSTGAAQSQGEQQSHKRISIE